MDEPVHGREIARRVGREVAAGVGGQVIGLAALGNTVGGMLLGQALVPVLGVVGPLALVAARRALTVGNELVEEAARQADGDVTVEEFAERIAASDDAITLYARVLDAAADSTLPGKLRALATALEIGVDAPAKYDEARLIANALAAIEYPHARMLAFLGHRFAPPMDPTQGVYVSVDRRFIDRSLSEYAHVSEALIQTLNRAGLIHDVAASVAGQPGFDPARGPESWDVTPLGERCLDLLTEVAYGPMPDHGTPDS